MRKMNKLTATISAIFILNISISVDKARSYHNFFFRSAEDIVTGTLSNDRLDKSSVTLLGPNPAFPGACTALIGPAGKRGMSYTVTNTADWLTMLAGLGLGGLTYSSTVTATVCMSDGAYPLTNIKIPRGLTVVGQASTTIVDVGGTGTTLITNYGGTMRNLSLDLSNLAFTVGKVLVSSFSVLDDIRVYNAKAQADNIVDCSIILVKRAYDVKISKLKVYDANAVAANAKYGDSAPMKIDLSSNVVIQIDRWDTAVENGVIGVNIGIVTSTDVHIVDSNITSVGGTFVFINDGSAFCSVERTRINMNPTLLGNSLGVIAVADANATNALVSSGTVINAVNFFSPGDSTSFIASRSTTANAARLLGIWITNCTATSIGATKTANFIVLSAGTYNAVLLNNTSTGITTALSDSATNTQKSGNFNEGSGF